MLWLLNSWILDFAEKTNGGSWVGIMLLGMCFLTSLSVISIVIATGMVKVFFSWGKMSLCSSKSRNFGEGGGGQETWNISHSIWRSSFLWLFFTGRGGGNMAPLALPPLDPLLLCKLAYRDLFGPKQLKLCKPPIVDLTGKCPLACKNGGHQAQRLVFHVSCLPPSASTIGVCEAKLQKLLSIQVRTIFRNNV